MRILYVHNWPVESSCANIIQVLHMCWAFAELGHDTTLLIPSQWNASSRVSARIEKELGAVPPYRVVPYQLPIWYKASSLAAAYFGVSTALRQIDADICILRDPLLLNLALRAGFCTVFESHKAHLHRNPLLNRILCRGLVRACRKAAVLRFISISQRLSDVWIERGVPPRKAMTLHDGVDCGSYDVDVDVPQLRRRLRLPSGRQIVTYAGSLYRDRGLDTVLRLAVQFPSVLFVIVGGPDERATHLSHQVAREGLMNVILVGRIPHVEVRQYLVASDILLMIWSSQVSTIQHCSPLKMFEYMAAGRTIVGHSFPTIREVLTDGKNALLAAPDDFEGLARKLSEALRHTSNSDLGKNARMLAFEKYDWRQRAQAILTSLPSELP